MSIDIHMYIYTYMYIYVYVLSKVNFAFTGIGFK